jgi:hypothetical protein
VSRFSDADDNDFAARFNAILDHRDGAGKIFVEPFTQALELEKFDIENAPAFFQVIHLP